MPKKKKQTKSRLPKEQVKPNKKEISRISLVSILLFIFALVGALADLSGANSQIRQWGQNLGIGLPFPMAKNDEILIIVTNFSGDTTLDAETRIYRELKEKVLSSELSNVRVEKLEDQTPITEQDANKIGFTYQATIVIWGTVDAVGFEPRYTITKNNEYIETKPDLGITLADDYSTFSAYVVIEAPREFEYLMLFSIGQISYFREDYEKAISLFTQAIGIDLEEHKGKLNLETVYYYRGFSHLALGEIQIALEDLSQAISINGSNADFFSVRGNIYIQTENYELAFEDHNRAIELNPNEAGFYINRGNVYSYLEEFDQAIEAYNQAIALNSELALAYMNRGVVYSKQGKQEIALKDFNSAIELDQNLAGGYYNRGMIYYHKEDFESAIRDYTTAIDKGWDFATVYYYRGDSYHAIKDYQSALSDYNNALALEPNFTVAYNNRGNVYHSLNNFDAALTDFNYAIQLSPDYALAYYNRGVAKLNLNDINGCKDIKTAKSMGQQVPKELLEGCNIK